MMLQGQHVDVNDLGHQQRSKQIVQTENFGRNRPVPRQLVEGKDADSQQAAAHAACQPSTYNFSH